MLEKTLYIQEASKDLAKNVQTKRPREEAGSVNAPQQQSILGWVSKPMSSEAQNNIDDYLLEAIIHGGVPFRFADNIFFRKFVNSLCSTYKVPSGEILRGRVLTNMFSKLLGKKLNYLPSFKDYTICFDGWTDVSGNSIYAFMVLKEECEDVLDIIDLSEFRHTALELKSQLLSNLLLNGARVENAIACVTDSPSNMVKLRNDLKALHPNIVSIRCCLHGFNLLAKDIAGFPEIARVVKVNQKLVNYFTSSHIWRKALKNWQVEKKIPHFLSTFCETRWYSLAKVCLGVAIYEEGFRHCLELSKNVEYPSITNSDVRDVIKSRHHFADNECLVEALKPVIDVIGKLEQRTTTLADVLGSFITLYHNAKNSHYAIRGFQQHILGAIGKRVQEFEDPIYFVALFLHPGCKKMAMSRKMTGDLIIKNAMEIAKNWNFSKREVLLLMRELINYKNGDAPFDGLNEVHNQSPRVFWNNFCGASPMLRRFATMLFSIVPHSAPCERLFSTLGLIKTKPRNRLEVGNLNMIAQIKCDLASQVQIKNKVCKLGSNVPDGLSMGDFDIEEECDDCGEDLLNEEIIDMQEEDISSTTRVMEDFFDFDAFELYNMQANSEHVDVVPEDDNWSVEALFSENI